MFGAMVICIGLQLLHTTTSMVPFTGNKYLPAFISFVVSSENT
jgi:hypothetical protein